MEQGIDRIISSAGGEFVRTEVIMRPSFQVVGIRIEANVESFESGLGKDMYARLLEHQHEISCRKNDHVILMQIYPLNEHFDARRDAFTHLICYEVTQADLVPAGMVHHTVQSSEYVVCTHKGAESSIHLAYDYLYGSWPEQSGRAFKDYDFEIWDERYHPESPNNEIDIYVALS